MTIEMVLRSPSLCIPVQFTSFSVLKGEDGVGVPKGGRVGQVLKKKSDADYDTDWQDDVAGGGGTVVTLDGVAQPTFPADTFVDGKISRDVVDGAPESLDTIGKLANALGNDPNFIAALLEKIGEKADAEQTESALAGKLDKYEGQYSRIYGTANGGKQMMYEVSGGANKYTVAYRGADGVLGVGTAIDPTHAVPLAQMNGALETKAGVEVEGKVDSLEKKVDNLLVGQAPDMFFDDDATAFVKEIPEDVAPYAAVKSVGGMIHAHQLPPPNLFKASVLDAENGRTYYDENNNQEPILYANNGTYTVNLANYNHGYYDYTTAATVRELFPDAVAGKKYTLSYDAQGESDTGIYFTGGYQNGTFTMTDAILDGHLVMNGAQTLDEYDNTYWPTEATYSNISLTEEGGGERYLTEAKVTALDIYGKNLYNGGFGGNACATEENGVLTMTMSQNGDRWAVKWFSPFPMDEVTICCDVIENSIAYYFNAAVSYDNGAIEYPTITSGGVMGHRVASIKARADGAKITAIDLYLQNGEAAGVFVKMKNFMILPTATPTDTTYSPYHKTTFAIPEAVQALDGYGWGAESTWYGARRYAVNSIDWDENGKPTLAKRVEKKVFDGTESWQRDISSYGAYFQTVPDGFKPSGAIVGNRYSSESVDTIGVPTMYISNTGVIVFPDNPPDTAEGWKAQLAEWYANGDPLTVYYELAEPIVTDISHLITDDNLIPVEGGGVIIANNENEEAAPTTIRYQVTGATLADAFDQIHEYAMQKIGGTT